MNESRANSAPHGPAGPHPRRPRRRRWRPHHLFLLILFLVSATFWLASAFFTITVRHDMAGSVEWRGGSLEVFTKTQKQEQSQTTETFQRQPPWSIRWAWPLDRGHMVEKNSPEFARGESIGWHPPRSPELFFRPWVTTTNKTWFLRAPFWIVALLLGLLVALLRFLHVRSPFVPRCEKCNYSLEGIAEDGRVVCPECGREQRPTAG